MRRPRGVGLAGGLCGQQDVGSSSPPTPRDAATRGIRGRLAALCHSCWSRVSFPLFHTHLSGSAWGLLPCLYLGFLSLTLMGLHHHPGSRLCY